MNRVTFFSALLWYIDILMTTQDKELRNWYRFERQSSIRDGGTGTLHKNTIRNHFMATTDLCLWLHITKPRSEIKKWPPPSLTPLYYIYIYMVPNVWDQHMVTSGHRFLTTFEGKSIRFNIWLSARLRSLLTFSINYSLLILYIFHFGFMQWWYFEHIV